MLRPSLVPVGGLTLIFVLVLASACASRPPPAVREAILTRPITTTLPAAPASGDSIRSNIAIAPDIRAACGISDSEAFFPYDSAKVQPEDRAILRKLADCFATGPLKNRQMRLVGRADPRGDEEYNYLLGQRRADNVKFGITSSGMVEERVATTSRGEDDANGRDEAGWAKDRRVDVVLGK